MSPGWSFGFSTSTLVEAVESSPKSGSAWHFKPQCRLSNRCIASRSTRKQGRSRLKNTGFAVDDRNAKDIGVPLLQLRSRSASFCLAARSMNHKPMMVRQRTCCRPACDTNISVPYFPVWISGSHFSLIGFDSLPFGTGTGSLVQLLSKFLLGLAFSFAHRHFPRLRRRIQQRWLHGNHY